MPGGQSAVGLSGKDGNLITAKKLKLITRSASGKSSRARDIGLVGEVHTVNQIDTDLPIGEEGSAVTYFQRRVGMVTTEEYNAPILALGGLRTTGGENGIFAAKVITDIANKKQVALSR